MAVALRVQNTGWIIRLTAAVHNPLKITIDQIELTQAWEETYSPQRNMEAMQALADQPMRIG